MTTSNPRSEWWLIHRRHGSFRWGMDDFYETWLIHTWHDSFICTTTFNPRDEWAVSTKTPGARRVEGFVVVKRDPQIRPISLRRDLRHSKETHKRDPRHSLEGFVVENWIIQSDPQIWLGWLKRDQQMKTTSPKRDPLKRPTLLKRDPQIRLTSPQKRPTN